MTQSLKAPADLAETLVEVSITTIDSSSSRSVPMSYSGFCVQEAYT